MFRLLFVCLCQMCSLLRLKEMNRRSKQTSCFSRLEPRLLHSTHSVSQTGDPAHATSPSLSTFPSDPSSSERHDLRAGEQPDLNGLAPPAQHEGGHPEDRHGTPPQPPPRTPSPRSPPRARAWQENRSPGSGNNPGPRGSGAAQRW